MNYSFVLVCVLIYFSFGQFGEAIDLQSVEEGPCIVPPVDSSLDLLWIANIAEFYYPIIHKYALFKYAITLSGYDPKNITEEMAHNTCQILIPSKDSGGIMTAFKGARRTTIDALITDNGVLDWVEKKTDGTLGHRGRSYVTLTDNEKYIVSVSCFEVENQKTYEVVSNSKTLDEKSKRDVWNHLKQLGFDLKNWHEPQYDKCYDLNPTYDLRPPNSQTTYNSTNGQKIFMTSSTESQKKEIFIESLLPQVSSSSGSGFSNVEKVYEKNPKPNPQQPQPPSNVLPVNKGNVQRIQYNYDNANKPNENISPKAPAGSKTKDSIEMFFNIFRAAIDFMQNFYKNTMRYVTIVVTRLIGRINSAR